MYTIDNKSYPCCTSVTMRFIGGKWKAVILYHLTDGAKRYNELRKVIPTITERTLSLQLKQLEDDNIIDRKVYTEKPPLMVEYTLTDFGKTLLPVLDAITEWGKGAANNSKKIIKN
ncbi:MULTISPECIES: winged helix-turn-helix transcriptional regulator [unclassified Chryseobacterium]|uniref:winged helix-turn-helix transcriptional regulator n=1 Tax=unclassified Chryseobacterium TaxID=2593645 RepID=UPI00100B0743|nr:MULTISPECIES: winged helix-turn-helix transcriptional regulator [unclassified Chryseobacterium]RXM49945.1 MarR family transcriptional regulator [Chryseobacterium sp. CH25]RXM62862.1 MarR family transcriptional regulator [Chryseobacterium sp. CH1]